MQADWEAAGLRKGLVAQGQLEEMVELEQLVV